jgi:hypothetical protein
MSGVKKVCWNCVHCDTFAGICLKGKFEVDATSTILIQSYACEEFDDSLFTKMNMDVERLKAEVKRLKHYIYKSGFCGYTGVDYDYHKIDCEKCFDRESCERYQIVNGCAK